MKSLTVHARVADYEKAAAFIEDWLHHCRLGEQIISENSLVFETLFNDILLKGFPEDTEIKIETGHSIGNPVIKIGFSGARYVPISADDPEKNIEYRIIKAYEDKLNYDYRLSYNIIRISIKQAYAPPCDPVFHWFSGSDTGVRAVLADDTWRGQKCPGAQLD